MIDSPMDASASRAFETLQQWITTWPATPPPERAAIYEAVWKERLSTMEEVERLTDLVAQYEAAARRTGRLYQPPLAAG